MNGNGRPCPQLNGMRQPCGRPAVKGTGRCSMHQPVEFAEVWCGKCAEPTVAVIDGEALCAFHYGYTVGQRELVAAIKRERTTGYDGRYNHQPRPIPGNAVFCECGYGVTTGVPWHNQPYADGGFEMAQARNREPGTSPQLAQYQAESR